jgi:glycosyltransferase involved in cell wall biosynthesis
MRIAWFTPFAKTSAIGECSSIIVRQLAEDHDVVVYASDLNSPQQAWLPDIKLRLLDDTPARAIANELHSFDIAIYNLGDHYILHGSIFEVSRLHPGIIILHDLVMHHFFSGYYFIKEKNRQAYIQALQFAHGDPGRQLGERVIAGEAGNIWEDETMLRFHMAKAALHGALGVVTHSRFALRQVEAFATYPTAHIHFPTPNMQRQGRPQPSQKVRLLSFGNLNSNKMLHAVIEAIGQHAELRQQVVYDVIGSGQQQYIARLNALIKQYQLLNVVKLHGYQPGDVLHQYVQNADLVINLRNPHFGESSWVLLETAFAAKPVMVWKHGYYDEYPDDAVAKVTQETMTAQLVNLVNDPQRRLALSKRIEAYARATFSTAAYSRDLLGLIETVRYNQPVLNLVDHLSAQIRELDPYNAALIDLVSREVEALNGES